MRAIHYGFGVLLLCLLQLAYTALPAHAADVFDIPETCGSAGELAREVAALRAGSARAGTARPDVQLRQQGEEFVLQVALPDGARTLRDPDCRALFRAAIVIAALGHETSAEAILEQTEAEPSAAPPPSPSPAQVLSAPHPAAANTKRQPEPEPEPEPERTARRTQPPAPQRADAFVQAELAYGVVPALSAALSAGFAWQRGQWGLRLTLGYLTPRSEERSGQGVRIQALDAGLSAEFSPLSWLHVALGADLFLLRGRGVGVRNSRGDWTAQPAPMLGLRARLWQRGRFALGLTGRALWSPQPSRFDLRGGGSLYTAERFAFQLGLAASLQFL